MALLIIIPFLNGYFIGNIPNIFRHTHFVGIWVWGQGPGAVSQIAVIAGMIYLSLGSPAGVEHFDT